LSTRLTELTPTASWVDWPICRRRAGPSKQCNSVQRPGGCERNRRARGACAWLAKEGKGWAWDEGSCNGRASLHSARGSRGKKASARQGRASARQVPRLPARPPPSLPLPAPTAPKSFPSIRTQRRLLLVLVAPWLLSARNRTARWGRKEEGGRSRGRPGRRRSVCWVVSCRRRRGEVIRIFSVPHLFSWLLRR
jgi:hypothetical protein